MKAKKFEGEFGVVKKIPDGGRVHVAYGHITTEGDDQLEAIGISIVDKEENIVTEFALTPTTFGLLIEAIYELYGGKPYGEPV